MIKSCKGCRYKGEGWGQIGPHCNYAFITGRTRLGQMTPEERREAKRTGTCPFREEGARVVLLETPKVTAYQQDKLVKRKSRYDQEELRRLYMEGKTDREIGAVLGCSKQTALSWRRREGLPPNGGRDVRDKILEARRLYDLGMSDADIARGTGLNYKTIQNWRRKEGLPGHDGRLQKRVDYNAVRRLYMEGRNDQEISRTLGCGDAAVFRWRQENGLPAVKRGAPRKENI